MSFDKRALENPINWSFGIGRLFGIRIRIHLFFVFGAVFLLAEGVWESEKGASLIGLGHGTGMLAALFLIVLLHEFGHCFGARAVGGSAEQILMWPLGGLATVSTPHTARANLITALAGPAVNVVICLLLAVVLVVLTGSGWAVPWNPFDMSTAIGLASSLFEFWLMIVFRISYILLLFNMAPVFPLDGGRVFQCLMWPSKGFTEATKLATLVGMWGAVGLAVIGIVSRETLLFVIAVFGYLTCWQQRQQLKMGAYAQDNEFGYDFSQGYTSLDGEAKPQRRPGFFARRRAARAVRREQEELRRLEEQQRQVDAILAKISQHGPDSLTAPKNAASWNTKPIATDPPTPDLQAGN